LENQDLLQANLQSPMDIMLELELPVLPYRERGIMNFRNYTFEHSYINHEDTNIYLGQYVMHGKFWSLKNVKR
jgi:hypothetical protein